MRGTGQFSLELPKRFTRSKPLHVDPGALFLLTFLPSADGYCAIDLLVLPGKRSGRGSQLNAALGAAGVMKSGIEDSGGIGGSSRNISELLRVILKIGAAIQRATGGGERLVVVVMEYDLSGVRCRMNRFPSSIQSMDSSCQNILDTMPADDESKYFALQLRFHRRNPSRRLSRKA